VVVFLHGMGSDHLAFDKYGVSDSLFEAMASGRIPPAHLILPNGERGFYLNWYDGSHPYEDYILNEVIPEGESALGITTPTSRHIAGVSMGGTGALQIGLRNPGMFSSIACISGVILTRKEANEMMHNLLVRAFVPVNRVWGDGTDDRFSDSINLFKLAARLWPGDAPALFLTAGDEERDRIRATTRRFHEHLERLGLSNRYVVYKGDHDWHDWTPVIEQVITFAAKSGRMASEQK
jgi:putative tributyrin esterase